MAVHRPSHPQPAGPRRPPFAGDGTVEELDSGRCSLEMGSWSWIALASSIGQFDTDIEVVSPPELAEAFTALASRYAAAGKSSES
nr:WYL domain-containing protein [Rhodococcus sp. KBS0724]